MNNGSGNRLDRIEALLENSIIASNARMDRLEAAIETFREPIEILLESATRHDAMISRLDAILERMIYREGRGNDDPQQ